MCPPCLYLKDRKFRLNHCELLLEFQRLDIGTSVYSIIQASQLLDRSIMFLPVLLACQLLVVTAQVRERTTSPPKVDLSHDELEEIEAKAKEILDNELRLQRRFLKIDSFVNATGTTIHQHSKFTFTNLESIRRGENHRLNVIITTLALKRANIPDDQIRPQLETGFGLTVFCDDNCTCDTNSPYRTADGHCNNLEHSTWGMASIPMRRWLYPAYDDGVSTPRQLATSGAPNHLPSARTVSTTVHTPSTDSDLSDDYTHMLMQWGQFLDHDITSTPTQQLTQPGNPYLTSVACCRNSFPDGGVSQADLDARPQCFPIQVLQPDRNFTFDCMNFVRSVQVENANCTVAPVEQLNQITAYIDASQVYGSSQEEQNKLRTFVDGLLKVSSVGTTPRDLLPEDTANPDSCNQQVPSDYCFLAGDHRVNENPTLQSMHTIFMREHNRIARRLKQLNCYWSDERIFQEARKIVGAIIQEITYDEYLPIILGTSSMTTYGLTVGSGSTYANVYSTTTDASIRNAFAAAAFRMGHSMIRSFMSSFNVAYANVGQDKLSDTFGNTNLILSATNRHVGHYCRGLVKDCAQSVDGKLSQEVTDRLFPDSDGNSLDLAALNIQRGRDHGLPSYTHWRHFCGVPDVASIADLVSTHTPASVLQLNAAYADVKDIDLFTGGLSEKPVPGGLVGPTFACLLGKQFEALKKGDRFWFEEDNDFVKFTPAQLEQIRNASLSRVVCDNTNTGSIQPNAFFKAPAVPCGSLDEIDLTPWKECQATWSSWTRWGTCSGGIQRRTRRCGTCNCGCEGPNVDCRLCRVVVDREPINRG
ncbi:salivary peroxidase/catechol oxidase-like [Haliotis cracherodii]|uniref:salivary peroxidase/catechol oxidase-like n=1 Tax=Haliotis cracherodii TaxID=6455 RepID=UPI0039E9B215